MVLRHSYHTEGKTYLEQMRSDAVERTTPNNRFGRDAEQTVVHLHPQTEKCANRSHEFYGMNDGQIDTWKIDQFTKESK